MFLFSSLPWVSIFHYSYVSCVGIQWLNPINSNTNYIDLSFHYHNHPYTYSNYRPAQWCALTHHHRATTTSLNPSYGHSISKQHFQAKNMSTTPPNIPYSTYLSLLVLLLPCITYFVRWLWHKSLMPSVEMTLGSLYHKRLLKTLWGCKWMFHIKRIPMVVLFTTRLT